MVPAEAAKVVYYEKTGENPLVVKGQLYLPENHVQEGEGTPAPEPGRKPAIILIHEWWGLNRQIRDTAKRFAKEGYIALAVDLYNGVWTNKPTQARELAKKVRKNLPAAFENLKAAIAFLQARADVDPTRIASIGWCFGGGWSLQMARNNLGVKASVIYYGFFNPKDDLSRMRAKIQGHFGKKDRAIKVSTVKELQMKLKTQSGMHEIFIYPNSGHAFFNPNSPNYNRQDAQEAWKRTIEFLKKHV